jgi:hypothetical protein
LSSITASEGELNPAFSPGITAYTLLVPSTAEITISATAEDSGARVQSPVTTVSAGTTSRTITIRVTAANGTTAKNYTVTVNKTAEPNAVYVAISRADERIDLAKDTTKDLSQAAGDTLVITAPTGYSYAWRVDGNGAGNTTGTITLDATSYGYGTHSVLLEYTKDGIPYGCEVTFRVVR